MRHRMHGRKLGRSSSHRKAYAGQSGDGSGQARADHDDLAESQGAQPYVEKLVTLGKRADLHARRLLIAKIRDDATARGS